MLRTFGLTLSLVMLPACSDPVTVQSFSGPTMGSSYEVKVATKVPLADIRALVEAELAAFDLAFSNWRIDSEIQRVNAHQSTEPFAVSERFEPLHRHERTSSRQPGRRIGVEGQRGALHLAGELEPLLPLLTKR